MATIPLPALHLNPPPQQESPLDQYARLMQLKNIPLQQQAMQQQVQMGQLDVQQKQQQIQDAQTLRTLSPQFVQKDASGRPTGYDYDGFYAKAQASGVSPQTLLPLQKNINDAVLSKAQATKAQRENEQAMNDQAYQHVEGLRGVADPNQRQQLWGAAVQWAQQKGLDTSQFPQQAPDDKGLNLIEAQLGMHAQQLAEASKTAENFKNTQQGNEAQQRTLQIQQQMQYGPTGEFAKAKYQFILQKAASGQPLSPDEVNYAKGYEASEAKNTTQSDTLGITSNNASRPAGLSTVLRNQAVNQPVNPAVMGGGAPAGAPLLPHANLPSNSPTSPANVKNSLVDMIGQYKETPALLGRLIAKHPDMLAAVQQKYPDWDQTTYNAKNKLISDYTSGKDSQSINAMNTAVGHLAALDEAATALHNGNVQALNSVANKLGVQFGADPTTTYNLIVHRVGPEIASSYIPGGGGEGERQATAADFSSSMSPQQIHNNVAASINLFRSKVAALENQYKQTVGRDDFQQKFFTPEARAAFQKYGAQGGGAGNQPNIGDVKTFPNGKKGKWDGTGWEAQ